MKKFILLITLAGTLAFSSIGICDTTLTLNYFISNRTGAKVWMGPFSTPGADLKAQSDFIAIGSNTKATLVVTWAGGGNFQFGLGTAAYQNQTAFCMVKYNVTFNWGTPSYTTDVQPGGSFICDLRNIGNNDWQLTLCKSGATHCGE